MKFTISKRELINNNLSYKFTLAEKGNYNLNFIYLEKEDGKIFNTLNFSLCDKYKFTDNFIYQEIEKLDRIILPFLKREYIWNNRDFKKFNDFFYDFHKILIKNIKIERFISSNFSYKIQINFSGLLQDTINKENFLNNLILIASKKSKKKILDNLKFIAFNTFYTSFPDISSILNFKILDYNKLAYYSYLKSRSKKKLYYSSKIEVFLYYLFLSYFFENKTNNLNNFDLDLLKIFLQQIFEKTDKDYLNKDEYFEIVNRIKQKIKEQNSNFNTIMESILLLALS